MAKLFFRYSAMNAGKSTSLLQIAYNYEEQGQRVALFTAAIDDRSGVGCISSRLGLERQAGVFDGDTDFWALLAGPQRGSGSEPIACVLIDESQFLTPAQVRQLHRLANTVGLPIICFGLRSDFMGQPFPGSAHLLTWLTTLKRSKPSASADAKPR